MAFICSENLFPDSEKRSDLEDEPRIGTNKDGDWGFRKIGIKNTLLMFIVAAGVAYIITLFVSGIFSSKKVITPNNLVQTSKVNESQQNPASNLPSYNWIPN